MVNVHDVTLSLCWSTMCQSHGSLKCISVLNKLGFDWFLIPFPTKTSCLPSGAISDLPLLWLRFD